MDHHPFEYQFINLTFRVFLRHLGVMLETFYFQKSKIMCNQIFLYHFKIEIGKQVP